MMTVEEMVKYDMMVAYEIATVEELNLARCLCDGSWDEIMDRVCQIRTGYRNIEQYITEEFEDED